MILRVYNHAATTPWCEHVPLWLWLKLYVPSLHCVVAPAALRTESGVERSGSVPGRKLECGFALAVPLAHLVNLSTSVPPFWIAYITIEQTFTLCHNAVL